MALHLLVESPTLGGLHQRKVAFRLSTARTPQRGRRAAARGHSRGTPETTERNTSEKERVGCVGQVRNDIVKPSCKPNEARTFAQNLPCTNLLNSFSPDNKTEASRTQHTHYDLPPHMYHACPDLSLKLSLALTTLRGKPQTQRTKTQLPQMKTALHQRGKGRSRFGRT